MPCSARKSRTADASVTVRSSSGTLSNAIASSACFVCRRPADRLEQKLEDLHVSHGIGEGRAPRAEPVSLQQNTVRSRVLIECLANDAGQASHVLVVCDDRYPLTMRVRAHAVESLEHLVAFNAEAAVGAVAVREKSTPHGVCV